jgi:hypothetical protein
MSEPILLSSRFRLLQQPPHRGRVQQPFCFAPPKPEIGGGGACCCPARARP